MGEQVLTSKSVLTHAAELPIVFSCSISCDTVVYFCFNMLHPGILHLSSGNVWRFSLTSALELLTFEDFARINQDSKHLKTGLDSSCLWPKWTGPFRWLKLWECFVNFRLATPLHLLPHGRRQNWRSFKSRWASSTTFMKQPFLPTKPFQRIDLCYIKQNHFLWCTSFPTEILWPKTGIIDRTPHHASPLRPRQIAAPRCSKTPTARGASEPWAWLSRAKQVCWALQKQVSPNHNP